jgi:hypothetical protein
MKKENEILLQHLREQIALEEHVCKTIRDQVDIINEISFKDAREVLQATSQLLELHFTPLNRVLDVYEESKKLSTTINGKYKTNPRDVPNQTMQISRILRDDYAALNHVTISTTQLHTLALSLGARDVAELALTHLENLAPLVVKIGELIPSVTTRELVKEFPSVDQGVAQTALLNTKRAWKKCT